MAIKSVIRGVADRAGIASPSYRSWVNAAVINANWSDLQLSSGGPIVAAGNGDAPNVIDSTIAQAVSINGGGGSIRLKLRVFCGTHCPSWAKTLDGSPLDWHDPQDSSLIGTVPRWWTPNFLAAYTDLMTKLAVLYDTEPLLLDVVIGMTSTQFVEPFIRQAAYAGNGTVARAAGYTGIVDKAAIRASIAAHGVWTNTRSSMAFNPYTTLDTTATNQDAWMLDTMQYMRDTLGARAVLGNNSAEEPRIQGDVRYSPMYLALVDQGAPLYVQTATAARLAANTDGWEWTLNWAATHGINMVELPAGYTTWDTDELQAFDVNIEGNDIGPDVPVPPTPTPPSSAPWTVVSTSYEDSTSQPACIASNGAAAVVVAGKLQESADLRHGLVVSNDAGLTWSAPSSIMDSYSSFANAAPDRVPVLSVFGNGLLLVAATMTTISDTYDSYVLRATPASLGTWTAVAIPQATGGGSPVPRVTALAWVNDTFLLATRTGASTTNVLASADGASWTAQGPIAAGATFAATFATDGEKVVAGGNFAGWTTYSRTGAGPWTASGATGTVGAIYHVAYANGMWRGARYENYPGFGPMLFKSDDGETWLPVTTDPFDGVSHRIYNLTHAGGFWWASGMNLNNGASRLAKSANGETWIVDPTPYDAQELSTLYGVAAVTNGLVGAGNVGVVG